jgi:ribonuclease HII
MKVPPARAVESTAISRQLVAGVDEAGRGPLAGPVVAAAVILDERHAIAGLADSKALRERRRTELADQIRQQAMAWAIGSASVEEIDRINILQATLLAMQRAVQALEPAPGLVLVDGNQAPRLGCTAKTVVRGDALIPSISAASILAKVTRDALMVSLDAEYPGYGFAIHKGYPTTTHRRALESLGITPEHRRSFGPVRKLLNRNK